MNRRSTILGLLGTFAVTHELRAHPAVSPDLLRVRDGDRVIGAPEAPIVIVEYASFTCAACARFHNEVLPAVKRRWIDGARPSSSFVSFRSTTSPPG